MAPNFKVIIVGGGVAGLSLANILQKVGIDYVVLEAHRDITPQIGASIGLQPHGLRFMHQIGCYDEIKAIAGPIDVHETRSSEDGRVLYSHKTESLVRSRHAYDVMFLNRQDVLQVLHNHLDKSKVLVNKKVLKVDHLPGKVQVHIQDGSSYDGDILIGTDGVHSTIRKEMCRIADELEPGYIPISEKTAMPCEFGCVFGLSSMTGGVTAGQVVVIHKEKISFAIIGGPKNQAYWFLFFTLDKKHHYPDIPRFTTLDLESLALQEAETCLTTTAKFKDLWKNREFATMTALPEYVFKRWYFGRTLTLGDAAHKFHPITGQGGNAAMDTSTVLANNLVEALKASPSGLSDVAVKAIFASVQDSCQGRIEELVQIGHEVHRLSTWATPIYKYLDLYIIPHLLTSFIVDQISLPVSRAASVHALPTPHEPCLIPFEDELLHPPRPRGKIGMAVGLFYILLIFLAIYTLMIVPGCTGTLELLEAIVKNGKFDGYNQTMIDFQGVEVFGSTFAYGVAVFFPATEGWDRAFQLFTSYLSISEFAIFTIWTVESCRPRNMWSPIRWAFLFGSISNITAIALGVPIFFLVDLIFSRKDNYWWPTARPILPKYAKTILPSMLVGMLLPTLLMFAPFIGSTTRQYMGPIWTFFPFYIFVLQEILVKFSVESTVNPAQTNKQAPFEALNDVLHLKNVYRASFIICASSHIFTIGFAYFSGSSSVSVSQIFGFNYADPSSVFRGVHNMFLWDFYITFAACLMWCFVGVWDLDRMGIARVNLKLVLLALAVGSIVVGPGATMSMTWYWREIAMTKLAKVAEKHLKDN